MLQQKQHHRWILKGLLVLLSAALAGCSSKFCQTREPCANPLELSSVMAAIHEECSHPLGMTKSTRLFHRGCKTGCRCELCRACSLKEKIPSGPPPYCYEPPMPPKFLPVPVKPVYSPVNPAAPDSRFTPVEIQYSKQWEFPAGD